MLPVTLYILFTYSFICKSRCNAAKIEFIANKFEIENKKDRSIESHMFTAISVVVCGLYRQFFTCCVIFGIILLSSILQLSSIPFTLSTVCY